MADTMSDTRDYSSQSSDPRDSGTAPPRSESRGRSFSFMRRQSSKDGLVPTRSTSLGRKLTRRRTSSDHSPIDPVPPRLPSMILSNPGTFPPSELPASYPPESSRTNSVSPFRPNFSRSSSSAYQQRAMNASGYKSAQVPPIPEASPPSTSYHSPSAHDPHARSESMTNRGRFSYASTTAAHHSNSPRRIRRRKDPTPFNVLVVGTKGCGKTSLVKFLETALAKPIKRRPTTPSPEPPPIQIHNSGEFPSRYIETEIDGERVGLTLYDSKGLERHLVDLQLREMSSFLESKFQETFNEEQKVMRAAGLRDTHIHCVLMVMDPSRLDNNISASRTTMNGQNKENGELSSTKPQYVGGLDIALDIEIMRVLETKTTIIPIISKADTFTIAHMAHLKRSVFDSLKMINFNPLDALNIDPEEIADDDESDDTETDANESVFFDDASIEASSRPDKLPTSKQNGKTNGHSNSSLAPPKNSLSPPLPDARFSTMSTNVESPLLPMSIISPDEYDPGVIGRRFPWGMADPYNAEHCDFVRLKETVFSEWRAELRDVSRERWYEAWRTNRLKKRERGATSSMAGTITSADTSNPIDIPRQSMASTTNGQSRLSPPISQRAVSSAAAYGSPPFVGNRQSSVQTRAVSANEIGVAIGDAEPHAQPQTYSSQQSYTKPLYQPQTSPSKTTRGYRDERDVSGAYASAQVWS